MWYFYIYVTDGRTKATSVRNVVVLCLVVDKVLRSEGSETLLIVCVVSQKRVVARRVKTGKPLGGLLKLCATCIEGAFPIFSEVI